MNKYILLIFTALAITLASCEKERNLGFDINFKLQYDGKPLVMFQDYTYPTGEKMNFTRYSFYLTNVAGINEIGTNQLLDASYLNFTDQNIDLAGAEKGITLSFKDLGDVNFDQILFMIGVDATNNAKTPADFNSSNPLSKTSEYWPGWESYVFTKTEGKIDFGNADLTPFALHTGGDEANITFLLNTAGLGDDGKQTLEIIIDLKSTFGDTKIYDIKSSPNIHSASQKAEVLELANNLRTSLSMRLK